MDPLVRLQSYLEWLISHPVAELNRAQRFLRFAVDLVRHCSRELRENDAAQMAAALTYRTIFGLVPLLMVSMLAFRLFGDMDDAPARHLQSAAYSFFNYDVDTGRPEAIAFKAALDERLLDLMRSVSGLSFEAIGARRRAAADLGRARAPDLARRTPPTASTARRAAAAG